MRQESDQGQDRAQKKNLYWLWLFPVVAILMYRWWGAGLPTSPRGESAAELGYLWLLRRLWASGDALRGWNPLLLAGEPTATARVYHLHLALAGLSWGLGISPEWVLKGVQFVMALLGAWGMYAYMRQIKVSVGAALVGAAVFALFPARVMLTVESLFVACAWAGLGWVFWAYERARVAWPAGARAALQWGVALAWIALTGTQWLLLLVTPLLAYVLLREGCAWLEATVLLRQTWITLRRLLLAGGVAALALVALSLFYYLPALLEGRLLWSERYVTGQGVLRWSIPWSLLLKIIFLRWQPGFDPLGWDLIRILPNISWYLGLVACFLAILGLARWRAWPLTGPLLGVALLSLCLAAGPSIPRNLPYLLLRRLPYLSDSVRNAFRYLWPVSLCLGALAGLGIDGLLRGQRSRVWQGMIVAGALCLILLDYWPLTRAYGTTTGYLHEDEVAAHEALSQPDEMLRFAAAKKLRQEQFLTDRTAHPCRGNTQHDRSVDLEGGRYWVPFQLDRPGQHYTDTSYGARYSGRASVNDNEYHTPSAPYRSSLYFGRALRGEIERPEGLSATPQAILDLANVRYALVYLWPDTYRAALARLEASGHWRVIRRTEHIALLENLSVRPLAQAYGAGLAPSPLSDDELLALLPQAVERGYALVEWPQGQPDETGASLVTRSTAHPDWSRLPAAQMPQVQLAVARPHAAEVRVTFRAAGPFLLMLGQSWYPHWHVTVNGRERPLLRLNGAFQGVYVEAGEGQAIFRYRRPWYVWLGYVVSAATTLALLVGFVRSRLRAPRHAAE